jgi:hypothetical protein
VGKERSVRLEFWVMEDRDTIGDGGAGAIVAGLVLVVAVVIAFFFFVGTPRHYAQTIDVSIPKVAVGTTPAGQ